MDIKNWFWTLFAVNFNTVRTVQYNWNWFSITLDLNSWLPLILKHNFNDYYKSPSLVLPYHDSQCHMMSMISFWQCHLWSHINSINYWTCLMSEFLCSAESAILIMRGHVWQETLPELWSTFWYRYKVELNQANGTNNWNSYFNVNLRVSNYLSYE